jgi:hypothetical protein
MKPFLSGREQVSSPALQALASPVQREAGVRIVGTSHTGTVKEHQGTPSVECVKQGDKVVRLIVTCGCGERIEVDCVYPGGG